MSNRKFVYLHVKYVSVFIKMTNLLLEKYETIPHIIHEFVCYWSVSQLVIYFPSQIPWLNPLIVYLAGTTQMYTSIFYYITFWRTSSIILDMNWNTLLYSRFSNSKHNEHGPSWRRRKCNTEVSVSSPGRKSHS